MKVSVTIAGISRRWLERNSYQARKYQGYAWFAEMDRFGLIFGQRATISLSEEPVLHDSNDIAEQIEKYPEAWKELGNSARFGIYAGRNQMETDLSLSQLRRRLKSL